MKIELSQSEENYLKSIFKLSVNLEQKAINTNLIAEDLVTKASSVTEMIKKLSDKSLVDYKKYKGATLTKKGTQFAIDIIRKHRLWETFLVEKLNFKWDEVHEVAEQLEHINSNKLTERLEVFLNFPKFDPHGDPIPDSNGEFPIQKAAVKLSTLNPDQEAEVIKINSNHKDLLLFLTKNNIGLHTKIKCIEINDFDDSMLIEIEGKNCINLSKKVIKHINVIKLK
jgi:DtxR family Mn-dependent transcriptional regulator